MKNSCTQIKLKHSKQLKLIIKLRLIFYLADHDQMRVQIGLPSASCPPRFKKGLRRSRPREPWLSMWLPNLSLRLGSSKAVPAIVYKMARLVSTSHMSSPSTKTLRTKFSTPVMSISGIKSWSAFSKSATN